MSRAAAVFVFITAVLAMAPGGCEGPASKAPPGGAAAPQAKPAAGPDADKPAAKNPAEQRKIRYTATVEVVVKDLDAAQVEVDRIIAETGGYVARSEVTGSAGSRRTGTWSLKVPVDRYRPAVQALAALGNTLRNSSDSEDVTEEFVDLEARLRNLRAEEEALNKLLKDTAAKLDDVLKMREQIVKTRGDIERAEGRLKFLSAVTSYSTVNLTLQEIQDYKPPTAPTFRSEVSETYAASLASLETFGRGVALFLVAVTPWLPVVVPAAFVVRWGFRRMGAASRPSGSITQPLADGPRAVARPPVPVAKVPVISDSDTDRGVSGGVKPNDSASVEPDSEGQ